MLRLRDSHKHREKRIQISRYKKEYIYLIYSLLSCSWSPSLNAIVMQIKIEFQSINFTLACIVTSLVSCVL